MTWQELVDGVHQDFPRKHRPPRKVVVRMLRLAFDSIAMETIHGARMSIPGFGVFTLRKRKARRIRNPQTHEMMSLPASKTIGFRCSKTIKR